MMNLQLVGNSWGVSPGHHVQQAVIELRMAKCPAHPWGLEHLVDQVVQVYRSL